jgi:hypothetical protein
MQVYQSPSFFSLRSSSLPSSGARPITELALHEEKKWQEWVDSYFVLRRPKSLTSKVHLLAPNIYRTPHEAFQVLASPRFLLTPKAFEYITMYGNFTSLQRNLVYYSGASFMYLVTGLYCFIVYVHRFRSD